MEDALKAEGWHLSPDGIKMCQKCCSKAKPTTQDIIHEALQMDLRQIGKGVLNESINRGQLSEVRGPMVLQIQKVRNIAAPKANEESQFAPRMLRLSLTDGVINCSSLELDEIPSLSLSSPPGSKICLRGGIPVQNGFLLLSAGSVKFLGGQVEKLKAKWEISKNVSSMQRKVGSDSGGPPPFVPFEQKDRGKTTQASAKPDKARGKDSEQQRRVETNIRSEGKGSDSESHSRNRQFGQKRGSPRSDANRNDSQIRQSNRSENVKESLTSRNDRSQPNGKHFASQDELTKSDRTHNDSTRRLETSEMTDPRSKSEGRKRDQDSNPKPFGNERRPYSSFQRSQDRRTESTASENRNASTRTEKTFSSSHAKSGGYENGRAREEHFYRNDSDTYRRKEQSSYDRGSSRRGRDGGHEDRVFERQDNRSFKEDRYRWNENTDSRSSHERLRGKGRYDSERQETIDRTSDKQPSSTGQTEDVSQRYDKRERRGAKYRDEGRHSENIRQDQPSRGRGRPREENSRAAWSRSRTKNHDQSHEIYEMEKSKGGKSEEPVVNAKAEAKEKEEGVPVESFSRRIDIRQGSEDSSASGRTSDGTLGSAGDLEPERYPSHERRRNYEHRLNRTTFELPPRYENLKNQRKKNAQQLEGAIRVEDLEAEQIEAPAEARNDEPVDASFDYAAAEEAVQQPATFVPMFNPQVYMRLNAPPVENQFAPMFLGINANHPQPFANNYFMAPRMTPEGQYYYAPNQPPFPMNTYIQQQPPPQPAPMTAPMPFFHGLRRPPNRRHDVHRPK